MIRTKLAALAACLIATSALAVDVLSTGSPVDDHCRYTANCDYEIREKLLSIPVWIFEATRAQRMLVTGQIRFEQQGYKLIAHIDAGIKCEAEITFLEGGFMYPGCLDFPKKYVQVDDAYQSILGTYIHTLRPPR